ncbi:UNC-like C-terminal-domain-containing protein [Pelagophyceae sp. CCMP2097]|nr:UNC-like C-terminal-domain-containing protein [Pelagophyceae sp. CCMP2097]
MMRARSRVAARCVLVLVLCLANRADVGDAEAAALEGGTVLDNPLADAADAARGGAEAAPADGVPAAPAAAAEAPKEAAREAAKEAAKEVPKEPPKAALVPPPKVSLMVPDDDEDDLDAGPAPEAKRKTVINYASMASGAVVLDSSPTSKGFHNLLLDDKDKYGNTPCADKKILVIGLSEDIQAREIILAQYEKYSSAVREFDVLGSQTYPTKEWLHLGTFEAVYGEREQRFQIADPRWVRYLKFRFLSHHGDQFVCTVSQIKVHGVTMMAGFHSDLERTT